MAVPLTIPWTSHLVMEESLLRQLIKNAKAGDDASFERLVILHERLVLRVAQRLLLNREDAKDAAQEVFIRLHRSLRRFDEEQDLGPWLYRVTVNICRDLWRRSKRDAPIEAARDSQDRSPDPESSAVTAQQYEMVLAALGQLTPHEREAIVLRDLEGRTTAEVAEILGSSETTVRSQLSTGRVKIRKYLAVRPRREK